MERLLSEKSLTSSLDDEDKTICMWAKSQKGVIESDSEMEEEKDSDQTMQEVEVEEEKNVLEPAILELRPETPDK